GHLPHRRSHRQPPTGLVQPQAGHGIGRAGAAGGVQAPPLPYRRPAAVQPGRRRTPGGAGSPPQDRDQRRARRAVRDAGIQPVHPRRVEECDRPRLPALWPERLRGQAGGRDRNLHRADRHRNGAAALAQRAGLPGHADARAARSLPAEPGGPVQRQGADRRGGDQALPAVLDGPVHGVRARARPPV
ncbi:MAG: Chromate reductase, partial [uncultured Ramlibacter sp.]